MFDSGDADGRPVWSRPLYDISSKLTKGDLADTGWPVIGAMIGSGGRRR